MSAGQLGGGKDRRTGVVDIATLQTLSKRTDVTEVSAAYGLVIVDECHHVPALAFENAVRQIPVRRWLGLTATAYRRDGHNELIFQQLRTRPTRDQARRPRHPRRSTTAATGGALASHWLRL